VWIRNATMPVTVTMENVSAIENFQGECANLKVCKSCLI
jgi:hypothetical protein